MKENLVVKAFSVALEKHKSQRRKIKDCPFIIHPISVANILISENANEELIAAGYLHDTVEDTDYTLDEIENDFTNNIKSLVSFMTEGKQSWSERKESAISRTKTCSNDELLLIFADKLSNLESIYYEFKEHGFKLFEKFSGTPEEIKDYYVQMLEIFKEKKPELNNLKKYETLLLDLFI